MEGLTILTGETGAGKSIILGALGLLQGNRADLSVVRDKDRKCIVEAEFNISKLSLKKVFKKYDLDYEEVSIVRREILPSGKSRAFINDTPVRLNILTEVGDHLIDIHSPHQTLQIANDNFQQEVLDSYVEDKTSSNKIKFSAILTQYQEELKVYQFNLKELDRLTLKKNDLLKELDYNTFLLNELEEVNLDQINEESIIKELDQLSNVEAIESAFQGLVSSFSDDESGIVDRLREHKASISVVSKYSPDYEKILERLESVIIEIEDIQADADAVVGNVTSDPQRMEHLSEVLNGLNTLYKKHQVDDAQGLIQLRDELAGKVLDSHGLDSKITKLEHVISEQVTSLTEVGEDLHVMREQFAITLEKDILEITSLLGMPDAVLKININKTDQFFSTGLDQIKFLFSANKGGEPLELNKAASGGELSRLMLAIKSILSRTKKLPTIVFDEIDTGVSGRIADKMAAVMKDMSRQLQVITITHLPQIAASGNDHLVVAKENQEERTVSSISRLNKNDRVEEIAQMLSGGEISEAARDNARILLK